MVHKKYTYKDGKRFGPYYYETKRVDGNVVTTYLGTKLPHKKIRASLIKNVLMVFAFLLLIASVYFISSNITGNASLDIKTNYNFGESINGKLELNIFEGELIPADSVVLIEYGNFSKEFLLSDLISDEIVEGQFYAKGTSVSGSGFGYGLAGKIISYPLVNFDFYIFDENENSQSNDVQDVSEQPSIEEQNLEEPNQELEEQENQESSNSEEIVEEQASESNAESFDAGITGAVIAESDVVSGAVSKEKEFTYSLNDGQTASLVEGSVNSEGIDLTDDVIKFDLKNNEVLATTDFFIENEGFGSDYAGDKSKKITLNLDQMGLIATQEDDLKIKLIYNSELIVEAADSIIISNIEFVEGVEGNENQEGVSETLPIANESILNETQVTNVTGINQTQITNVTGVNQTILNETQVTNVTGINQTFINETLIEVNTTQYGAVIGQPVKWVKTISLELNDSLNLTVEVPASAENLTVNKISDEAEPTGADFSLESFDSDLKVSITGEVTAEIDLKRESFLNKFFSLFGITGRVIEEDSLVQEVSLELNENDSIVEIEYYTGAPIATENVVHDNFKTVLVSSPEDIHYENVLVYTSILDESKIKDVSSVRIEWAENDSTLNVSVYNDTNSDGYIDYIEWIAPHLSNQTFNIILITSALHLDENRNFLSNIYNETRDLDDYWSETIHEGHYVRVTFEMNLTSDKDITVYPRIVSGNPKIEIYEVDGNEVIAEFTSLEDYQYNKVFLKGLQTTQDTFDMLILGGKVEFDHIIDPVSSNPSWWTEGGVLTLSSTTNSVDLSKQVNMSKTFILTSRMASINHEPDHSGAYVQWVNGTRFNLIRNTTSTGVTYAWYAVEGNYLNVQNGTKSFGLTEKSFNITLNSVNVSRTVPFITFSSCSSSAEADTQEIFWIGNVTNSTNLVLSRDASGACSGNISYFVTEFNDGSTIQKGEIANVGSGASPSFALVSPVNLSETWFYFTSAPDDTATGLAHISPIIDFVNSTTFRVSRHVVTGNLKLNWYAISTPGSNVQYGLQPAMTSNIIGINPVQVNRSFTMLSFNNTGTGTYYSNTLGISFIVNQTAINISRGLTSNVQAGSWQIVEFPGISNVDRVPIGIFNFTSPINGSVVNGKEVNITLTLNDTNYVKGNSNFSIFYIDNTSDLDYQNIIYQTSNFSVVNGLIYFNYSTPFIKNDSYTNLLYHLDNNSRYGENESYIYDFSGRFNSGKNFYRPVNFTKGILGGAVSFNGTGDHIYTACQYSCYSLRNSTYVGWARSRNITTGYRSIIGATAIGLGFGLFIGTESNDFVVLGDGVPGSIVYDAVSNNEWFHFAVQLYQNGSIRTFINGNPTTPGVLSSITDVMVYNLSVGVSEPYSVNARFWEGDLDEIAIINRTLNDSEIYNYYKLKSGTYYLRANVTEDNGLSNLTQIQTFTLNSFSYNETALILNSTLGLNRTLEDLNINAVLMDQDNDKMNVTVRWYNNSILHLVQMYNGSYSNGTTFIATLGNGNTTRGESWNVQLIIYDRFSQYSVNSSNLVILNTLPNITLISPSNNSVSINRTNQRFTWSIDDPDGDEPATNKLNISLKASSVCVDNNYDGGNEFEIYSGGSITDSGLGPLNCLLDNNDFYFWSVNVRDGVTGEYSGYSAPFVLNIQAYLNFVMNISSVDFGNLAYLNSNDTRDNSPWPIIIINEGNVKANFSIGASSLWSSVNNPSSYYTAKVDNVTTKGISENGTFVSASSTVLYTPVPMASSPMSLARGFNYQDDSDAIEVDINVTVPNTEGPGLKNSTVTFTFVLSDQEIYV